jgi:hypothetical protein
MKYILKVLKGRKIVRRIQTDNRRVFAQKLASLTKLATKEKWYLRVNYKDWYNDGEYTNKTEMIKAYKAFTEK